MSGTLFVVATPIGNLEDITLRALRVLREADLIAAEDTRRTAKLLAHYAISTPTISFHEHNSRQRVPELIERLQAGGKVALVSDAGTPGIADPGIALVQACWEKSIPIDPVPGASAPLAAAVASGFPLEPLTIVGFVPARANDRTRWLQRLRETPSTIVFFESPHRIERTLAELAVYFGDRPICVGRELTKVHQELIRGDSASIIGRITNPKGEFTVVIGPQTASTSLTEAPPDEQIYSEFCGLTNEAPSRRAAVAELATKYGLTTKYVYSAIERLRGVNS
ncbi:MAG: 16S rRNA (cytidine(1402)-2'-O)-methyltransferase [Acidobacteria bacterium]|nr:16S rRNA (cytidine(1402)-2'-O)-methyltransferase [Acidobacteriota bacterium]